MVASTAKVAAWIALGGSLALGGLVVRHLTEADLHALIGHLHTGQVEKVQERLVAEAEAAAEAEKQALLESAEQAAAAAVDAAAEELKAQVDQAAEDAKARVRKKLMGEADEGAPSTMSPVPAPVPSPAPTTAGPATVPPPRQSWGATPVP
jgi:hypothetical protein